MAEMTEEYMNLYGSRTYLDDIYHVIGENDWVSRFEGKALLVTGASGLICSSLIDLLLLYNDITGSDITIYAAGRDREKMKRRFSKFFSSPYLKYAAYNASTSNTFDFDVDYIIHGAGNAFPSLIQAHPVETMKDNFCGMLELLEYAEHRQVSNTVFISSSEIYGCKSSMEPFTEEENGYIDILNPRSAYPMGKRAAETLCASYACEKNVPVSIVRPGHIYGPTASRSDNRVSSAFAYDAAAGKDLVLKSEGSQVRSYCYMLDCATAILKVVLEGKTATAYNISNPLSIISIREMAAMFAKYGEVSLRFELPTRLESAAFNPMSNSSLNSDRLQALGWKGAFDASRGIEHTIRILKESLDCG